MLTAPDAFRMRNDESVRYCIALSQDRLQEVCDKVDGSGVSWITGWKDGQRCVWWEDVVTATKIVLLTDTLMEEVTFSSYRLRASAPSS